jgi:hypothetical protein
LQVSKYRQLQIFFNTFLDILGRKNNVDPK